MIKSLLRLICLAAPLVISACQQVGQFTAQDAIQASAIDPLHAACYQAFGNLGTAEAGVTHPGVLTVIATKEQLQAALQNPTCAPITVELLADLIKIAPGAGSVIGVIFP